MRCGVTPNGVVREGHSEKVTEVCMFRRTQRCSDLGTAHGRPVKAWG